MLRLVTEAASFVPDVAMELDRVALVGEGSEEEPLGVQNTTGVQTLTSVGTPTDYSKFSSAVELIAVRPSPSMSKGAVTAGASR